MFSPLRRGSRSLLAVGRPQFLRQDHLSRHRPNGLAPPPRIRELRQLGRKQKRGQVHLALLVFWTEMGYFLGILRRGCKGLHTHTDININILYYIILYYILYYIILVDWLVDWLVGWLIHSFIVCVCACVGFYGSSWDFMGLQVLLFKPNQYFDYSMEFNRMV